MPALVGVEFATLANTQAIRNHTLSPHLSKSRARCPRLSRIGSATTILCKRKLCCSEYRGCIGHALLVPNGK
jgi:hypothetical protein